MQQKKLGQQRETQAIIISVNVAVIRMKNETQKTQSRRRSEARQLLDVGERGRDDVENEPKRKSTQKTDARRTA